MDATPRTPGPLLKAKGNVAFTEKGLTNFMADTIDPTGLPDRCVTHGLRKAAARLLAEAGCTPHQIMAITGHKTLAEVERYTKAAERKRLAMAAMGMMPGRLVGPTFPNPVSGLGVNDKKFNENSGQIGVWRTVHDKSANTYVIEIAI